MVVVAVMKGLLLVLKWTARCKRAGVHGVLDGGSHVGVPSIQLSFKSPTSSSPCSLVVMVTEVMLSWCSCPPCWYQSCIHMHVLWPPSSSPLFYRMLSYVPSEGGKGLSTVLYFIRMFADLAGRPSILSVLHLRQHRVPRA